MQVGPQLFGDPVSSGSVGCHQVEHEVPIRAGAGDAIGQGCLHGSAETVKTVAQPTMLVYDNNAVVPNAAPIHSGGTSMENSRPRLETPELFYAAD